MEASQHRAGKIPRRPAARPGRFAWAAATSMAAVLIAAGLTLAARSVGQSGPNASSGSNRVCGQRVLRSPYDYDGKPGRYASGVAGLPTYGRPGTDFPDDTSGEILPADSSSYASYQLSPDTVYYLLPGTHTGSFMADARDAFVGGFHAGRPTILSGGYSADKPWAIDSNSTDGNQIGVTIEYLTVEKYKPSGNAAAINQDTNTGWVIRYNTITLNVPGAGILAGTDSVITGNCLTRNGQYGFQSTAVNAWGTDALTGGPYDLVVKDNEISYNDTCDFEGRLTNQAVGWYKYNPVPEAYRNPHCGLVQPDGDQGGFKLWQTNGVTVAHNYIHHNWGPGAWVDTDNANTTFVNNTITNNDGPAIIEEASYDFSISHNYLARNGWVSGLSNPDFPTPAVYISESGSDQTFGGVPACPEASCARQASYRSQSAISDNELVNNSGSIFLWQSANRYCSDGADSACTLVARGSAGPFTQARCRANLPSASVDAASQTGNVTGSPAEDWWDGCLWRTENVLVTRNTIDFNPADVQDCNSQAWPACGAGGMFSQYGSPPNDVPGWVVPTQLTFFQHNTWSGNIYAGPSTFYAWNQGNRVTWAEWTGMAPRGSPCESADERRSGACAGPFGQDAGSTLRAR